MGGEDCRPVNRGGLSPGSKARRWWGSRSYTPGRGGASERWGEGKLGEQEVRAEAVGVAGLYGVWGWAACQGGGILRGEPLGDLAVLWT